MGGEFAAVKQFHYRGKVLSIEYLRAGVGLAITTGPLLLLDPAPIVGGVLGALAILFAAFALRTGLRNFTVIEMTEEGIAARGPISCSIPWRRVKLLRLDYYCTGRERDGGRGWMQLKIAGQSSSIRIDSTIDGFDELAAAAAGIATRHSIPLSDTTAANFQAIGIPVVGDRGEMAA